MRITEKIFFIPVILLNLPRLMLNQLNMNFIVSSSALLKHLNIVAGVVPSKTLLPIVENFMFSIENENLIITATDLENSMQTTMSVKSNETFSICIPAKLLLTFLKELPEQPLNFSVNSENFGIDISFDTGKYHLAGEDAENYPTLPVFEENTQAIHLPYDVMQRAIAKCSIAIADSDAKPAMTGIFCSFSPTEGIFVATDAHKLVRYKNFHVNSNQELEFVIPFKALTLLKSAHPDEENLVITFDERNVVFSTEKRKLYSRFIDDKYPNYERVIPVDSPNRLIIDRDMFKAALKRFSIFASANDSYEVRLSVKGSELSIEIDDMLYVHNAKETLPCSYEGEDLLIAFNVSYLIALVNSVESSDIVLEMSGNNRAAIIVPSVQSDDENYLSVLMPLTLGAN